MKRGFMEASASPPPRKSARIDADPVTTQDTDLASKLLPDSILAVRQNTTLPSVALCPHFLCPAKCRSERTYQCDVSGDHQAARRPQHRALQAGLQVQEGSHYALYMGWDVGSAVHGLAS